MRITDVPATRHGHHVNCRDANVSFSVRIFFWYHGHVLQHFPHPPLSRAHC
jgi:hypothetical protein